MRPYLWADLPREAAVIHIFSRIKPILEAEHQAFFPKIVFCYELWHEAKVFLESIIMLYPRAYQKTLVGVLYRASF